VPYHFSKKGIWKYIQFITNLLFFSDATTLNERWVVKKYIIDGWHTKIYNRWIWIEFLFFELICWIYFNNFIDSDHLSWNCSIALLTNGCYQISGWKFPSVCGFGDYVAHLFRCASQKNALQSLKLFRSVFLKTNSTKQLRKHWNVFIGLQLRHK